LLFAEILKTMASSDIEKASDIGEVEHTTNEDNSERPPLKLDRHGLPLVPQPSDHPDDPLNWSLIYRIYIALLIALLGFIVQLGAALINPAFEEMSEDLSISVEQASYCTTVYILFGGVLSMFVVPFANVYGRRPAFAIFVLLAAVGSFVSASAPTYGGVIGGRVINGIGACVPLGIGAAVICDTFSQGERGLWMGIYTLSVTNGPHVAPIAGGYIAERLGWRWSFWIPGFMQAGLWVVVLFTLPETLFSRRDTSRLEERSFAQKLLFHGKVLDRKIRVGDFIGSLRMGQYLAVLFPCLWYMTANTYGSVLFAVTGAHLCVEVFGFELEQIGLFLGVPLTIGCMIGEATAGWVSDAIINAYAKRHDGYRKPEARLYLLPLCTLLGIGTSIYGYCVQTGKPWIDAAVVMAISGLGTQVGTTMVYTYTTDSYKPQSGEIGAVINLFKSGMLSSLPQ
jgi:MFS family permease